MKLQKFFFTVSVILTLSIVIFSQENPISKLASIYPHNCEFVNQYVDSLIDELEKYPNHKGFIVINWQQTETKKLDRIGFIYQDIISLEIKRRNFDNDRLKIIRSDKEKLQIDFYLTSKDTETPNFYEKAWKFSVPSKPIIFDEGYGGQLCNETPFQLNTFSEFLSAIPKAKGKFVVNAESKKQFKEEVDGLLEELRKANINTDRINFVYVNNKSLIYPQSVLWLMPKGN